MQPRVHVAQRQQDRAVLVGVVEQALGQVQAFVVPALVHQFAGQHQLQIAVLGIGFDRLLCDLHSLVEHLGVAVGVHLALVAARGHVAAHVDHLLVGGDGLVDLVLLVVDRAQPLKEDAAIVLFLGGVRAVGVRGLVHHLLVGGGGLVVVAQHVEQQAFVVAGLEILRVLLARLANGGQRIFILALAPLNFGNVNQRAGVLRIGRRNVLVLLQRGVELAIVQQRLAERVHRGHIARAPGRPRACKPRSHPWSASTGRRPRPG